METLEITLFSERSTTPFSEIKISEGRGGDTLEEMNNFDLSILNIKCLVYRKKCLQGISGLGFLPTRALTKIIKGKTGNVDLESNYIEVTLKMRSLVDKTWKETRAALAKHTTKGFKVDIDWEAERTLRWGIISGNKKERGFKKKANY